MSALHLIIRSFSSNCIFLGNDDIQLSNSRKLFVEYKAKDYLEYVDKLDFHQLYNATIIQDYFL